MSSVYDIGLGLRAVLTRGTINLPVPTMWIASFYQ